MAGRDNPRQVSPVGKPSITKRLTATPCGKFEIHTGHGVGVGQTTAARSFTGKSSLDNGATPKGGLSIGGGHGTEYGQTSSRG